MSYFKSFHVISYHFISFLSASLYPIWWNHEKWYYLIFVMRATSELYHLHTHASKIFLVDWLGHFTSQTNPETSGFISINIIQYWICGDVTWHKWNSGIKIRLEHLIFKILDKQEPWSRRTCNVLMGSSPNFTHTHILHENGYKFLVSMQKLGFRLLGFHHSAMERREDSQQRMLGSLPWNNCQFVGLCAEL